MSHTPPGPQSVFVTHSTHRWLAGSQTFPNPRPPVQFVLLKHWTQYPADVLQ